MSDRIINIQKDTIRDAEQIIKINAGKNLPIVKLANEIIKNANKIIEMENNPLFYTICPKCKTEYDYVPSDIIDECYVICPDCGEKICILE